MNAFLRSFARRFALAGMLTVTLLGLPAAASAGLTGTGAISGTLTLPGGGGAGSIGVYLDTVGGTRALDPTTTDGGGGWQFSNVPPGDYHVFFQVLQPSIYPEQYYHGSETWADATTITVTAGNTFVADDQLHEGGHIKGTVRNAAGSPLSGIKVIVNIEDFGMPGYWWGWKTFTTAGDGTYDAYGLPAYPYRIEYVDESGTYLSEWYKDSYAESGCLQLTPSIGETLASVDATMDLPASIGGYAEDRTHENHLAGIKVLLERHWASGWAEVTDSVTPAGGRYLFEGLLPGDYRVSFSDGSGEWAPQYYLDSPDAAGATTITVTAGEARDNVDSGLYPCPTISGTVRDTDGNGIADVWIDAWTWNAEGEYWEGVYGTSTGDDGSYEMRVPRPGVYRLQFLPDGNYVSQYYDGVRDWDFTTGVPVDYLEPAAGIDATLTVGGTVTGKVVEEGSGDPIEGIAVSVLELGPDGDWEYIDSKMTSVGGTYTIDGLPTDTYKVGFQDYNCAYGAQFYTDAINPYDADPVVVTEGAVAPGIDATLSAAASISGTITDASTDLGIGDARADVWTRDSNGGWHNLGNRGTDRDGSYTLAGLHSGTYWVEFNGWWYGYGTQVWNGQNVRTPSGAIVLGSQEATTGIDGELSHQATVSGVVKSAASGEPVPDAGVSVYREDGWGDWYRVEWVEADSKGEYKVEGLGAGTVRILAQDPEGGFGDTWYGGSVTRDGAEDVGLVAGVDLTAVDIEMGPTFYTITATAGPGGHISPIGESTVAPGADATFHITADAGWHIESVVVDSVDRGAIDTYTFSAVTATHTISATFAKSGTAYPGFAIGRPKVLSSVIRGLPFLVYGSLDPAHRSGSRGIRLRFERKVAGHWRVVKTVRAFSYGKGFGWNHYGVWTHLDVAGRCRVKAFHPADKDGPAKWTAYRSFRVR